MTSQFYLACAAGSEYLWNEAVMSVTLTQLQQLIRDTFGAEGCSSWRGRYIHVVHGGSRRTCRALRGKHSHAETSAEFADVLAWLATLANIAGVNLDEAIAMKYGTGCPHCKKVPCVCEPTEKP